MKINIFRGDLTDIPAKKVRALGCGPNENMKERLSSGR